MHDAIAMAVDMARAVLERWRWSLTTGSAASASLTTHASEVIASDFLHINRHSQLHQSPTSSVQIRTENKHHCTTHATRIFCLTSLHCTFPELVQVCDCCRR